MLQELVTGLSELPSCFLFVLRGKTDPTDRRRLRSNHGSVSVTVTVTVGAYFTYKDLCSNQCPQYYPGYSYGRGFFYMQGACSYQ
jgi:hypothetical protein